METKKFKIAYQLRFLPFIITAINLLMMLILKYILQIELGKIFGYSIFLALASFIYMQTMRQLKREKEQEDEQRLNPPPPPTKEELQRVHEEKMDAEIYQQKSNIGFRLVYLLLGIILFLASISLLISHKEYLYGGMLFIFSLLFIIHSVFVLRKWMRYLTIAKEEKERKIP